MRIAERLNMSAEQFVNKYKIGWLDSSPIRIYLVIDNGLYSLPLYKEYVTNNGILTSSFIATTILINNAYFCRKIQAKHHSPIPIKYIVEKREL